jgi:hypothetical protein
MIDSVRSKLRLIEQHFGTRFLGYKAAHPVRDHWRGAKRFLDAIGDNHRDLRNKDLAFILELAEALELTRDCENFKKEVGSRLEKARRFEGAHYELLVASAFSRKCRVELVRSHGKDGRPGDFIATIPGWTRLVECTKKRLTTRPLTDADRASLGDEIQRILAHQRSGLAVTIVIFGSDLDVVREVLLEADQVVASSHPGQFPLSRGGWMEISEEPALPLVFQDDTRIGVAIPAGIDSGKASIMIRRTEQGQMEFKNPMRVEVRIMDSHPFDRFVQSFRDKAGKFKSEDHGVISIGGDLRRVKPEYCFHYMRLVAWLLGRHAWLSRWAN